MLDLHMHQAHILGMTLDMYLAANALTEPTFAALLGVDQSTVNRLRKGTVPSARVMRRILEVTGGSVTPNDFFELPARPKPRRTRTSEVTA